MSTASELAAIVFLAKARTHNTGWCGCGDWWVLAFARTTAESEHPKPLDPRLPPAKFEAMSSPSTLPSSSG